MWKVESFVSTHQVIWGSTYKHISIWTPPPRLSMEKLKLSLLMRERSVGSVVTSKRGCNRFGNRMGWCWGLGSSEWRPWIYRNILYQLYCTEEYEALLQEQLATTTVSKWLVIGVYQPAYTRHLLISRNRASTTWSPPYCWWFRIPAPSGI